MLKQAYWPGLLSNSQHQDLRYNPMVHVLCNMRHGAHKLGSLAHHSTRCPEAQHYCTCAEPPSLDTPWHCLLNCSHNTEAIAKWDIFLRQQLPNPIYAAYNQKPTLGKWVTINRWLSTRGLLTEGQTSAVLHGLLKHIYKCIKSRPQYHLYIKFNK